MQGFSNPFATFNPFAGVSPFNTYGHPFSNPTAMWNTIASYQNGGFGQPTIGGNYAGYPVTNCGPTNFVSPFNTPGYTPAYNTTPINAGCCPTGVTGIPGTTTGYTPTAGYPTPGYTTSPFGYNLPVGGFCGPIQNTWTNAFNPGYTTPFNATIPGCTTGYGVTGPYNQISGGNFHNPIQNTWTNAFNSNVASNPFVNPSNFFNPINPINSWINPTIGFNPVNGLPTSPINSYPAFGGVNNVIPAWQPTPGYTNGFNLPFNAVSPFNFPTNTFNPNFFNGFNPIGGIPTAFGHTNLNNWTTPFAGQFPFNTAPSFNAFGGFTPNWQNTPVNGFNPCFANGPINGFNPFNTLNTINGATTPFGYANTPVNTMGVPFNWQSPFFGGVPFGHTTPYFAGHHVNPSYPFPTDRDGVTVTTSISPNGTIGVNGPMSHREAA